MNGATDIFDKFVSIHDFTVELCVCQSYLYLTNDLPSNFMPVLRHLSNLQAGHFFLVAMEIGH